jgi:hypothetical protein
MKGTTIMLGLTVIFFFILGLYLKIYNGAIEGEHLTRGGGFQHTVVTGNFVLFLSFIFLIPLIYVIIKKR